MYDPLGLSIGTTNLVVARDGAPPLRRRAVLTLSADQPPEIGLPAENPDRTERLCPGAVVDDFVARVGSGQTDKGDTHDPHGLLADALNAMISVAGVNPTWSDIAIAVPAHWDAAVLGALGEALHNHAGFGQRGVAPRLVSDAVAALVAMSADVGLANLPSRGVVALLDFGGGGTSITLADAGLGFEPVAETVRYADFSGDQIDRAVRLHVLNDIGGADQVDALGPLTEECRQAKERLSTHTVTALLAELPGRCCGVRLTREELENLIDDQLTGVIAAFDDMLARNKAARGQLAAVAMVGGGASIPLVAQRLSAYTPLPVVLAPQSAFAMASGAVLLAERGSFLDVPTPAAMAFAMAGASSGPPGLPVDDLLVDDGKTALGDLAWSQDENTSGDLTRYAGRFYSDVVALPTQYSPEIELPNWPPRRQRVPQLLVGLSAVVAMVAVGSAAYTLTSTTTGDVSTTPSAPAKATVPASAPYSVAPSPIASPPSLVPSVSAAPPPSAMPSPSVEPVPSSVASITTTEQSTSQLPTTTTTTSTPTTTVPTTTTATTTPPVTTTTTEPSPAPASASSTVPMTTQWLRVPLIPVPIPVPVPAPQYSGG